MDDMYVCPAEDRAPPRATLSPATARLRPKPAPHSSAHGRSKGITQLATMSIAPLELIEVTAVAYLKTL